jgi:hypothetical protein
MLVQEKSLTKTLYDADCNLWVLETVKQLESKDFESVDWGNLIEEVSDLSRLIEHLLKIKYWQSEREQNFGYWQGEVRNLCKQINKELKASTSLKGYCQDIFDEYYQDAREICSDRLQLPLTTFLE